MNLKVLDFSHSYQHYPQLSLHLSTLLRTIQSAICSYKTNVTHILVDNPVKNILFLKVKI